MGKIIGVFNQKGGVAKTTTTSNLGSAIAMKGNKVLMVDLDPQANCTNALGVDDETLEQSIYDLLISQKKVKKEGILEITKKTSFNVDLLPSDISLADAEQTLSNVISRETVLKKLLDQVRDDYDYILLDCPPSLGLLSINALAASDYIIIPVYPSYFSVKGIKHLLKTYTLVKDNLNQKLDIMGIVLTKFDQRINKHKEIKGDLEKLQVFENKVFKTVIRVNSELEYAQDEQKPITFYNTNCNGYIDYTNLADEVLSHD
mgnify:CR=1 FL=1